MVIKCSIFMQRYKLLMKYVFKKKLFTKLSTILFHLLYRGMVSLNCCV